MYGNLLNFPVVSTSKNLITVLCIVNLHKLTSQYVKKQRIKKLSTHSINSLLL